MGFNSGFKGLNPVASDKWKMPLFFLHYTIGLMKTHVSDNRQWLPHFASIEYAIPGCNDVPHNRNWATTAYFQFANK